VRRNRSGRFVWLKFIANQESLSGDPLVYPPQEQIDRMFGLSPKPPKVERVMTRAWTKFKTGL
jgi:putrescine transport system substrate-binding protein